MAYAVAVGNGWVSRSDFWEMPCAEFWWLVAAKIPEMNEETPSGNAEIYAMLKAAKAKEFAQNG